MYERPIEIATMPVVPLPLNGSRTVHGTVSRHPHLHPGIHPVVFVAVVCRCGSRFPTIIPECCSYGEFGSSDARLTFEFVPGRVAIRSRSIVRRHGVPHFTQHPLSLVPAKIARRGISLGNVAKWAPLNDSEESDHTVRTLRDSTSPATAAEKLSFCLLCGSAPVRDTLIREFFPGVFALGLTPLPLWCELPVHGYFAASASKKYCFDFVSRKICS